MIIKGLISLVVSAPKLIALWFEIQKAWRKSKLDSAIEDIKAAKTDEELERATKNLSISI